MASQTTTTHKREQTLVEPRENQLRDRLGFDRRGLRREFAAVESLDLSDKYIEQEDRLFIDPKTTDLPFGPSGMGETGGSGMAMYREEGSAWQTYRFTHGFTTLQEDLDASNSTVAEQRDEVIQIFDFFADSMFMKGIDDQNGNQIKQGMFSWLKSNIPSARTFDAEDYDGDSGDDDYTGVEENLIKYDAYESVSGNLLNDRNANWDLMVGRQSALANFNKVSGSQGGEGGDSYWDRLSDPNAIGGVNDWVVVPDNMEYPYTPADETPLTIDLTTELGDDEVILLPDMDTVMDKYWALHEMDEPEAFPMYQEGGGKMRQDYAWRYTHEFNPKGHQRFADAEDAIHIQNVSALFN